MAEFRKYKRKPSNFAVRIVDDDGGGTADIVDDSTGEVLVEGVVTESTEGKTDPSADPADQPSKGVLAEVIEAFSEIGTAFNALGTDFNNFGITMKNEPEALGDTIKSATDKINLDIQTFLSKFKTLGNNLSSIFQEES